MSADQLQPGEIIACRYHVDAHHRHHPLGELYRCRDETSGQVVLLQRLGRAFAGTEVRDRLFETREGASLESKLIADILDYGEDLDGRPFVVTAWSDDASLDAVERPLAFDEAVAIIERVAAALAPLHARRLVHGGIDPASVLVDQARELTALHGFGLAPALGAAAGRNHVLLSSATYAAPELIRGVPLGPTADVYALGVVLWELIFGEPPFRGPTLKVIDAHLNRPLPAFELPFDAPASFEWVLRRMLAKSPADRFADAGEVAAALRDCLAEAPALQLLTEVEDDEDDETVVFEAVRNDVAVPQMIPRGEQTQRVVPLSASMLEDDEFEFRPARRWFPRVAAAVLAVASLGLLARSAMQDAEPERIAAESSEMALVSHQSIASRVEPLAVEAVSRAARTVVARTSTEARVDPSRHSDGAEPVSRERIGGAQFRNHKQELYRRVERHCTGGDLRRSVKVTIRVGASGRVESATVSGKQGESQLGRCVERQARQLRFPASERGGSHGYTLRLK